MLATWADHVHNELAKMEMWMHIGGVWVRFSNGLGSFLKGNVSDLPATGYTSAKRQLIDH